MSNWIKLANFPKCFGSFVPKPIQKSEDEFIITNNEYHSGIYIYNIINNEMSTLIEFDKQFDEQFRLKFHSQLINKKNNKLYLFGGYGQKKSIVYDFNTKKLQQISTKLEEITVVPPRNIYIEKTDQIFGVIEGHHVYTFDNDVLTRDRTYFDCGLYTFGIPLKIGNEIKMLAGSDNFISTTLNASEVKDLNDCKWHTYALIKMPHIVSRFNYFDALAVCDIAIIFYYGFDQYEDTFLGEIWCIDFLNKVSFKCSETIPFRRAKTTNIIFYSMKLNNDIHLINFITTEHYKIDLYHLIPTQIIKKYSKYYNPLVFGYCKDKSINIPHYLIKLIFKYFPYFL